jgi:hypothetical protein
MTETVAIKPRKRDIFLLKALNATFKIPFVKVNRERFLRKALLSEGCSEEQIQLAIEKSPVEVLTPQELKALALKVRRFHRTSLSALSAACGVPGGIFIFVAVPVDTIQFFYHTFVLSQKIAYIYGFPPCMTEDEFRDMMIIALGVGAGVSKANKAFKFVAKQAKKQLISQLQKHQELLLPQLLREVCKALGVKLTNNTLTQIIRKGIPVISAVISAIFAYTIFTIESNRIMAAFENEVAGKRNEDSEENEFSDGETSVKL